MRNYVSQEDGGLFDVQIRLSHLSDQGDPLLCLDRAIPWERFRGVLEKALFEEGAKGPGGRPCYDPLLMFKILILQRYYNLSDEQTEYQINDRLSFQRFLGLGLGDRVPDARTVWFFREKLVERNLAKTLFEDFVKLLKQQGVLGKEGKIVDASFVEVPRQRNSRGENQQIKEGQVPPSWESEPHKMAHKDLEARWTQKGGETYYGYKDHIKIGRKSKLIERYEVSAANVHDSVVGLGLIEASDGQIWGDSAYQAPGIREKLLREGIQNHIHEKGCRRRKLAPGQESRNRKKSRVRARVEHVFGFLSNTMRGLRLRCIGMRRVKTLVGLINLVYNFARYEWLTRKKKLAGI